MHLPFTVVLAYTASLNVVAIAIYATMLASARIFVLAMSSSDQHANKRRSMRRILRWIAFVAFLVVVLAVAFSATLIVVGATFGAPVPDTERFASPGALVLAVIAIVSVPLVVLNLCLYFCRWYVRELNLFRSDDYWGDWIGLDRSQVSHGILFAVWQYRLSRVTMAAVLVLDTVPIYYNGIQDFLAGFNDVDVAESSRLAVLPAIVSGVLIALLVGLLSIGRPHLYLLDRCLTALRADVMARTKPRNGLNVRPARWRSVYHQCGFAMAWSLRRCIPGFRRRLEAEHFVDVSMAAARLEVAVQRRSIDVHKGQVLRDEFCELVRAGVALIVADNPVVVAEKIDTLLRDEVATVTGSPSRIRIIFETVSDTIQRYWPAVRVVLVTGVIVALIASGQLDKLVDILKG